MEPFEDDRRRKRRARLVLILLGLLIVLLVLLAAGSLQRFVPEKILTSQPGLYRVTEFADGDTIVVDMNGTGERVRFIGVDTPETHDPDSPVQCYGEAASAFTKQFIGSSRVRLEADPLNTDRDRYNRLLRYVYLPDGRLLNRELVLQGYGFAYTLFPFSKKAEFVAAETDAKANNRGLWQACQVTESSGAKHTQPIQ